ncbi:M23 family metallopeptidase [Candidatus Omnitrophota bacterium]
MKKILTILLVALPLYLAVNFYFLDRHYFISPIEYEGDIIIRSDSRGEGHFGAKRSGGRRHRGIDLQAEEGTPVLSSRSGRVAIAREQKRGMGKYIVIRHWGGMTTLYGHLSRIDVSKGQFVRQGQVIGAVGKTGNANYRTMLAHLHFEVVNSGKPQDPLKFLP